MATQRPTIVRLPPGHQAPDPEIPTRTPAGAPEAGAEAPGFDYIRVRGARTHNLKNVSLDLPRNRLIVITGLSGSGQVVARLRHALRRRPAPLRRIALRLRAAIPADHGKARRRSDRGPVPGHLDRAEGDEPQPALDGGHHHRDPRLPAAALRADRRAPLPRARHTAHRAERVADGGSRARVAGRFAGHDPRAAHRRAQGRAGGALRRAARAGIRATARSTARCTKWTTCRG